MTAKEIRTLLEQAGYPTDEDWKRITEVAKEHDIYAVASCGSETEESEDTDWVEGVSSTDAMISSACGMLNAAGSKEFRTMLAENPEIADASDEEKEIIRILANAKVLVTIKKVFEKEFEMIKMSESILDKDMKLN